MQALPQQVTEVAAHKIASAVQVAGTGIAVGSGSGLVFGLTPTEWSVVGIIGGLAVAVIGVAAKTCVDWYFQAQHLNIARARLDSTWPDGD